MRKDEREQLLFAAVVGLMKRIIRSESRFLNLRSKNVKLEMVTSTPVSTTFFNEGYFAIIAAIFSGDGSILKDCVLEEFGVASVSVKRVSMRVSESISQRRMAAPIFLCIGTARRI